MKKQFLAIAAAVVLFAACHNSGSSTVGEQDKAYQNSFDKHNTDVKDEHHTSPPDNTKTEEHADTTHHMHATDTTHH